MSVTRPRTDRFKVPTIFDIKLNKRCQRSQMPHTKMFSRFIIYSDAEFNRKKNSVMPPASVKMTLQIKNVSVFVQMLCCLHSLAVFCSVFV